MAHVPVPIIVCIIAEGASGGALGIGVGDRILMMENAWYSVISPEGCAAILWRDSAKAQLAAEILKLTAPDLFALGVIDEIVPEPLGGAHRDYDMAAGTVKERILASLDILQKLDSGELIAKRLEKYGKMGFFKE
jgi:acetyl-CoA carboxylase carboxyl transferase subunit alpha